jgi:ubiquinone/menaquinone biosynthesis C-methylase UbiE
MNDQDRLRAEYTDRERRLAGSDIYSVFNPANLFIIQQRQRNVLRLIRQKGFFPLKGKAILEVGCGNGGILQEYLIFGAVPDFLCGCELLPNRARQARKCLPHQVLLSCADGQFLPYPNRQFSLILQYTVFSSILDDEVKATLAREMLRVIQPGGMILWYDFWLNPTNPQTRGIRPAEIRQLFPNCSYEMHKITLAPPLARRIVPLSWGLALLLESMKIFNTHYLAAIRPLPKI